MGRKMTDPDIQPDAYAVLTEERAPLEPSIRHEISRRLAVSIKGGKYTLHVGEFNGRTGWAEKINLTDAERQRLHELTAGGV